MSPDVREPITDVLRLRVMRVPLALSFVALAAACTASHPVVAPIADATKAPSPAASVSGSDQPTMGPGCPATHVPPGGGSAAVHYVDFLQANGRNYIAGLGPARKEAEPKLGREVLRVRCAYAPVNDATGQVFGTPRDGDSAYLTTGTPVFAVSGWPTTCRLAAKLEHHVHIYLAYRPKTQVATPEPCALRRSQPAP